MLFKTLSKPDRQQTQLAYRIKYWPYAGLTDAACQIIRSNRHCYLRKHVIESLCDENKQKLFMNGHSYKIVWAYNNPPTEEEWNKKSNNFFIRAEFRVSPAIPEGSVVILNFELPSDMLRATAPESLL